MRRIVTAALTVLMAFSLMLSLSTTASANAIAGGGYSSSYSGESVFTNQPAGGSGQFSAIFFNSGTQTWAAGVVGLLVCDASKTTCNVASPNAAYASGWFSTTVYATVSASVPPGSNGFFVYNFTVPAGTAPGTAAVFNGDVGLIATGTELRPEGYFQINTAPGNTGGMTISPASAALPVGGQQQFTISGAPAGSSTTWTVAGGCGAVTNSGLFAATATNSPTQPCSVTASAGGASATAPVTVFGPASSIRCSATKATIPADGGSTITTVQGTLIDANGNAVANDNSTKITFTNNTPAIMAERNATQPSPRTAQNGVASKDYFANATGNSGTGVISLSSGTLTGCSESITVTGPGAATSLAASFYLGTISADGTSVSILEVDSTDANGVIVSSDNSSQISISRTTGASSCNTAGTGPGVGAGSGGPTTVSAGSAYFSITSTSTPGTCAWQATSNATGVTPATATLTTVITGAANNLAIQANASPRAADGFATLRVTVALKDASGNAVTTPASQVTVTATLGSGCSGTKADGTTGSVGFNDPANSPPPPAGTGPIQGTTTPHTAASNSYSGAGAPGASTNYSRFVFRSTYATPGCTVTFSDGGTVSSTTATIVFTAGGPANVACAFSPAYIINDGSSTSIATVSMVDGQNNLSAAGTFSVGFTKSTGTANTTLLTTSPQNTSNGIATFSVKSGTVAGVNTDTYTASTTIVSGGTASTGTCKLTTQPTLP
jgi:hypothetical protein